MISRGWPLLGATNVNKAKRARASFGRGPKRQTSKAVAIGRKVDMLSPRDNPMTLEVAVSTVCMDPHYTSDSLFSPGLSYQQWPFSVLIPTSLIEVTPHRFQCFANAV